MDDVRGDVIIAWPFKTNPPMFGVCHMYFDSAFVIAACIFMLIAMVIYMAHRYQPARVRVRVRTIIFLDPSDVPHNMEECCNCLCCFVVANQFASLSPCQQVYHRRCITRALAQAPTYPICRGVLSGGGDCVWHPHDRTRMLSFSFFFFFLCFSFLCRLTILTILMYIVA